jgi:VWFA-related protein
MITFGRLVSIVTAGLVLTPPALIGQAPAGQPQLPTFRAEGRVIEVDATVTDPQGRFVRGLTREDFEILEDGQPQEITAFTLVDLPVDPPASRGKKTPLPVDSDVVTNVANGRIYVMLLDSPGVVTPGYVELPQMAFLTQRVARRFVDEWLGPNDLMAVIHAQGSRLDAQSFTGNKSLLRASIDRLRPDLGWGAAPCDSWRIRNSYEALEIVSERLGALTGRRKAILWVNGRVPFDASDPRECFDPVTQRGDAAAAGSIAFSYRDAMRAATRNNVAIYPIDSVGLSTYLTPPNSFPRELNSRAALRGIAEDTGGDAVVNTNNYPGGFERIVRANSTYYLFGYRPVQDHRDGKFHAITVRVRRESLSVRARRGYRAPEPGAPAETGLLPSMSVPAIGDALLKALPTGELGIEVFLAPFKGTGRNETVVLAAELRGLTHETAAAESKVEVSYMAIDAQGVTGLAPPKLLPLDIREPRGRGDGAIRLVDRLTLPPGRHEVRIAVRQQGGAVGSAVAHVNVPDFARTSPAMSGLVFTAPDGSAQLTLYGDETMAGGRAADMTIRRRFARGDSVTALVEVYPRSRTRIEDVRMTMTIATSRGALACTEAAQPVAAEPGRAVYAIRLPLTDLTPGDYVVTMEAVAHGRTVSRQVPISVAE